jgi:dipeptide transport system substrate-binding protein
MILNPVPYLEDTMQRYLLVLIVALSTLSTTFAAKNFIYCSEGSPSAFNPQITTDGSSNNAAAHTIYEKLVDFKYGSTEIVPALAKSWTVSKDRKTYTFKLRKGVKFHKTKYFTPSREFNADDVIFSINRMRLSSHPYNKVSGGSYEYFNGMDMGKIIKDVKKLNKYSVRIQLTRPEAPFLANLAMSFMSILSKEYSDQLIKSNKKDQIDQLPVGTGPFVFRKYKKDAIIRYKKNKDYWGEKAKIDNLIFAITKDASVRTQKLKKGECHLAIEPAPADLDSLKKDKKLKVMSGSGLNVGYLAMNTQKAPLNNQLVRQAINMSLNKESYIKAIYLGHAIPAVNPLPPTIWSYNKKIKGYSHSVEKAKALLAKAGFPNGFETEIWTLPVTRPYNPNGKKMGEMMQADLAKVGIKAKLVTYDWPTYLKKAKNGEHQLIQLGWTGDNGDPDNFLYVLLGCAGVEAGANVSRWCHKNFESLLLKAKQTTNVAKRTKLYERAQKIFKTQAPWVPIAHSKVFRAMNKNVTGYKIDPLGGDIFKYVDLK